MTVGEDDGLFTLFGSKCFVTKVHRYRTVHFTVKSISSSRILLEWNEPRTYGIDTIRAYQVNLNGRQLGKLLSPQTKKVAVHCQRNSVYRIVLLALPADPHLGDAEPSNLLTVCTPGVTEKGLDPKQNIRLQPLWSENESLTVEWSDDNDLLTVDHYVIKWSSVRQPQSREEIVPVEETSYTIEGCQAGTRHFIAVAAVDDRGKLVSKSPQLIMQTSAPLQAPRLLLNSALPSSIIIDWDKPLPMGDATVDSYEIKHKKRYATVKTRARRKHKRKHEHKKRYATVKTRTRRKHKKPYATVKTRARRKHKRKHEHKKRYATVKTRARRKHKRKHEHKKRYATVKTRARRKHKKPYATVKTRARRKHKRKHEHKKRYATVKTRARRKHKRKHEDQYVHYLTSEEDDVTLDTFIDNPATITHGPLESTTHEDTLNNALPSLPYWVILEVHLFPDGCHGVFSRPIRTRVAVPPDPPGRVNVVVVGLRERQTLERFVSRLAQLKDSGQPVSGHHQSLRDQLTSRDWLTTNVQHLCGCHPAGQRRRYEGGGSKGGVCHMYSLVGVPTILLCNHDGYMLWQGRICVQDYHEYQQCMLHALTEALNQDCNISNCDQCVLDHELNTSCLTSRLLTDPNECYNYKGAKQDSSLVVTGRLSSHSAAIYRASYKDVTYDSRESSSRVGKSEPTLTQDVDPSTLESTKYLRRRLQDTRPQTSPSIDKTPTLHRSLKVPHVSARRSAEGRAKTANSTRSSVFQNRFSSSMTSLLPSLELANERTVPKKQRSISMKPKRVQLSVDEFSTV
ncbi:hypothetical protein QZH41_004043 [Actinostola sp. cb2023]|nr:hypothetical protein QZH41_004043 [Actinostola sp. cb2023]